MIYKSVAKRVFDIICAAGGLIVLAPVLVVIAILIRWRLGSPVIFRQQRPGRGGRPFMLYKFRTMTDERDQQGNLLPNSERITTFGRILRKSSLDELPELWNVLIGDMSLVGPRPLRMEYLKHYTPRQFRRHEVRPGITGWAQVNGRNLLSWEKRFELDVWYVENLSPKLDFEILLRTIKQVLTMHGTTAGEEEFVKPFGQPS